MEIHLEIASSTSRLQTYGRRLYLEIKRLQVENFDRFLSNVGQTIMGSFAQLNKFPAYVTSENLGIAVDLVGRKLSKVLNDVIEIDALIGKSTSNGQKLDQATKQKIDHDLEEIALTGAQAHNDISQEYYTEIERIRLEDKELNLMQKHTLEMILDVLNFMIDYTRHFEDLFNRINNF